MRYSAEETTKRIETFQTDLKALSSVEVIRKYITFGEVAALEEHNYYQLKYEISDFFEIHPSQVLMVGSGKTGFSISEKLHAKPPKKRYRHFSEESDLDMAIVSQELFDIIWKEVIEFSDDKALWPRSDDFKNYLFEGWIRPDKLPPSFTFKNGKEWWEFFRKLTSKGTYGPYKIAAGLYKSWYHLERYQAVTVNECKQLL
ncbi:hypothetical protein [Neolewinella agarilytica]|uniref:Uncharacterized protein n=1 Tax=Neolewinella agarilytica TaxID=478744 RepID=A0A1H9HLU7_9BACT|nr:hypothetical protein [Neolewinella agarilytica]SEQ63319.1 hypothetical protein SAMN05444359_1133 [Neolewinella agarilytica]